MAIPALGPVTLCAPGDASFLGWMHGAFIELLAPHVEQVARLARTGFVREIETADYHLEFEEFPTETFHASTLAGKEVLDARAGMRSCPTLSKLAASLTAGRMPGHHATVFAAQAAVLHLSSQGILVGFAFDEWRRVNPALKVTDFRHLLPAVTGVASAVFAGRDASRFQIA